MFSTTSISMIITALMLLTSILLLASVLKIRVPKSKTQELQQLISEGLNAYGKRVFSAVIQIVIYVTVVLLLFSTVFDKAFSWEQMLAFLIGSFTTTFASFISLRSAPKTVPKIMENSKKQLTPGLRSLINASAGIGFQIITIMLLGLLVTYELNPKSIIGYGLGAALSAFFLRIGGGIFKTSSDIGADIVEDMEDDIPKFDARNPATILDIIGDYVGDILGFSADLLTSFIFAIISAIIFSNTLLTKGIITPDIATKLLHLPLYIIMIGLLASFVGYLLSLIRIQSNVISNILLEGVYFAVILCGIGTYYVIQHLNIDTIQIATLNANNDFLLFPAYLVGLVGAAIIGFSAEVLTSQNYSATKKVAQEAEFGPVVSLMNGMALGLKSNSLFTVYMLIMGLASFYFAGVYGIVMAALGMLSITGLILSINIFGPLATHTQKLRKLTLENVTMKENTKKMEIIGETTAAIGNGYNSGASVLSTFSLLATLLISSPVNLSNLLNIDISLFCGLIIGISIPYLFSGVLIRNLIKTIIESISEAIRQFKDIPYLFENKARPDMIKASDVHSRLSMDALTYPGIIMLVTPILIGYLVGVKMLAGYIFGLFLVSMSQSYHWTNVGESLHNAKHFIREGHFGGKESPTYTNISIADNAGDTYKDLLGPAINILLKSSTVISILLIALLSS